MIGVTIGRSLDTESIPESLSPQLQGTDLLSLVSLRDTEMHIPLLPSLSSYGDRDSLVEIGSPSCVTKEISST